MKFRSSELARDLGGQLLGEDVLIEGLAIDSRELVPGQLFAAVSDVRDGHEFVFAAMEAGASAALVSNEPSSEAGPSILVPDVNDALFRLARVARRRLGDFVVGITGSVGKTTTKDLLAGVLTAQFQTTASPQSFNNELGVPLTLVNAPEGTEAAVVEMGARGHGHISLLCSLAQPTVGVVTAVEAVHTEYMGSIDQIAAAKRELIEALPESGLAVLNGADARVSAMAAYTSAEVLTFDASSQSSSDGSGSTVGAENVTVDDSLRPRFTLKSPWGSTEVQMGARGAHNVANALAAATVGLWAGISVESVGAALAKPIDSHWRMELLRTPDGLTVLNDSYNAGPASMAAALRSLAQLPASRRIALLATMAELGDRAGQEHEAVASLANELDIELISVGTDLYRSEMAVDSAEAAVDVLKSHTSSDPEGTAVLIKGSRVAGLETVVAGLNATAI